MTLFQVLLHVMNMDQPEPIPSAGSGRVSPDRSRVFRLLKLPLKPTAFSSKIPNKRYGGEGRNRTNAQARKTIEATSRGQRRRPV